MAHQTIFLQGDEVISALDEKRIFGKALNLNNSYLYAVQLKDGAEDLPKIKNISCKRNCFCSKFNFDT